MKVHAGLNNFKALHPVVTIGMFDGLHAGHRKLLEVVTSKARHAGSESVIVTFWPHPRVVLKQDVEKLRFLTSLEEKTRLFSETGIDHLVILPFTQELSNLTAEAFIKEVLLEQVGMMHLVVGYNHRFGKGRHHSYSTYQQFAKQLGFEISRVGPVLINEEQISSSAIRGHLQRGDIKTANQFLTYDYTLTGRVIGGRQLGRKLGYPTANIEVEEPQKLIPPDGVYACRIFVEGKQWGGMLNIGYRPTVSKQADHRTIEVHILDFERDIYSEEVVVQFVERVRDEMKFNQLEDLKKQLLNDEVAIRQILES